MSALAAGFDFGAGALQIAGGRQQNEAFREEAKAVESQGILEREEAFEEADRVSIENRKFRARQKLSFLKNGVLLEGSPLIAVQETLEEGVKQAEALRKRGEAKVDLAFRRGAILRAQGRAALLGGFAAGFQSFARGTQRIVDAVSSGGAGGAGAGGGG